MVYDSNGSVSIEAIFQSGNLYSYCMGNPVKFKDEMGKIAVVDDLTVLAIGAIVIGVVYLQTPSGQKAISDAVSAVGIAISSCVDNISAFFAKKSKQSNLPSYKKIGIDMDHIMFGHGAGGNRGGPNKDRFPWEMTVPMIEKVIREAYQYAEKIGPLQKSWQNGIEMVRQQFQGPWGESVIQFWFNYTTKTIESAWPK